VGPSRATEADKLNARLDDGRAQLRQLAAVVAWASDLAYAASGQRYDTSAGRLAAESRPPRFGDRAWADNYAEAGRCICYADQDLMRALRDSGIRWWAMQTAHVRDRMLNPSPAFLIRVARNALNALDQVPADPRPKVVRHLDRALNNIWRAHQLLPDTRNPTPPRVCANDDCERLLGDRRGGVCQVCANRDYRRRRRPAA